MQTCSDYGGGIKDFMGNQSDSKQSSHIHASDEGLKAWEVLPIFEGLVDMSTCLV